MENKMRIRNKNIFFYVLILILFGGAFSSWAEEEGPAASGSMAFLSKYMWRGYELSDGSMVVQPSVTLAHKGLAFNMWGNLDTDPPDEDAALTETDLTVSYDTSAGPFGLGAGYIYYGFDGMADTQEFYLKGSYDTFLTPTLTMYRDIDSFPGYYFNLGLSHSISLSDAVALNLSGAFGYYVSDDDSIVKAGTDDKYNGLQDGLLSASLSIPVTKYISVSPTVSYAFPLSDEAEDSLGITSGEAFGGVVLSISF
jgi:hypothetical protein